MADIIPKDGPVADTIAQLSHVPRERITDWLLIVGYDEGIQFVHTLCCGGHAREFLAEFAAHQPDIPDTDKFTGSN